MEIVRFTRADAPRFRALRLRALRDSPNAFGSTYERASSRSLDDWARGIEDLATFVAVADGVDIGMVRGARDRDEASSAWLISMWVAPDHRRTGVGNALIDEVVGWARAEGYSRIKLDVADSNDPAIRLYARKGFNATGEVGRLPRPRTHIREHRRVLELQ